MEIYVMNFWLLCQILAKWLKLVGTQIVIYLSLGSTTGIFDRVCVSGGAGVHCTPVFWDELYYTPEFWGSY